MNRLFRLPIACRCRGIPTSVSQSIPACVRGISSRWIFVQRRRGLPNFSKGDGKTLEDCSSASAWVCEQPCESGATTSLSNRNKEKRSGYLRSLRSLPKRIRPQIALQADKECLLARAETRYLRTDLMYVLLCTLTPPRTRKNDNVTF